MSGPPILEVEDLAVEVAGERGVGRAVDGVSLDVAPGAALGIVGESGSGKTLLALALLRLVPPPARIAGGRVRLQGEDLLALSEPAMRARRGRAIAMVFQEPRTALDPLLTIGAQIAEAVRVHERLTRRAARDRAVAMLEQVGVPSAEERAGCYPHQLSGGLRQRALIAMALVCRPAVVVADEPTTALDALLQREVLDLLSQLRREEGTALLLISHDIALVGGYCDEVAVMYGGRLVERGPASELLRAPYHPYTQALLRSMPPPPGDPGPPGAPARGRRLVELSGTVPSPFTRTQGCRFAARCAMVRPSCRDAEPALAQPAHDARRLVRCAYPVGAG